MSRAIILRGPHRHQMDSQPRGLDWPPSPASGGGKLGFAQNGKGLSHRLNCIKQLRTGVKMSLGGGTSDKWERNSESPAPSLRAPRPCPALPYPEFPANQQLSRTCLRMSLPSSPPSSAVLPDRTVPALDLALSLSFSCPCSPFELSPPSHNSISPQVLRQLLTLSLPLSSIPHLSASGRDGNNN